MRKHIKNILLVVITLQAYISFSQDRKNDTITTGVIDVVKPYTPSISDAFKVKETPTLEDETTEVKKEIKYNIFSFPVASTFTPAKGKAATLEKEKPEILYDNYATLGFGTFRTVLGELYLNHALNRNETVGGYVSHHSSRGGVEDVELNNHFSNSKVNVNYSSRLRDMAWNAEIGFQHQNYNWYGLPEVYAINDDVTDSLNVGHSFFDAHVAGDLTFEDTYINSGSVLFRRFGDNQGSGENRFILNGRVDVPINGEEISTDIVIDYLGGLFDKSYNTEDEIEYGNIQVGISPSYQLTQDNLTVNLGVSAFYVNNIASGDSKFYIYPNITASYRLVDELVIAFGGIKGDLVQNSYHAFANENPFVSPTLNITPTDKQYNAYVGLKGKVSSNMSYNVSGGYTSERNKALFKNNTILANEDYAFGNSFGIAYDTVKTINIAGQLNVDVNRNFNLGLKAEYFSYSSDVEEEAWNLPDVKGSLFLDYQINRQWFTGANLFFIGERKDSYLLNDGVTLEGPIIVDLDGYFDANVHVGYHVDEQFSVFAKANNIASSAYQRWQNFQVQKIQFLIGATYKF